MKASLAAGLQRALEASVIEMAGQGENLCLAGGLALNVLLVAALESCGRWKNVFVQPAAGNSGTALGAVYYAWHQVFHESRRVPPVDFCLGSVLLGRGDEAGSGELQAQLPLSADHRRADRDRRARVTRPEDRGLDARPYGVRPARARQSQHSRLPAESLLDRKPEHLHQAPGAVPKVRRVGSRGSRGTYFDVGPNARFLATVGRVRPEHRKHFEGAILGSDLVRVHTVRREENPCSGSYSRPRAGPRDFRCSTTPRSISSETRWSAPRATPCAVSTPPASTPCSPATSTSPSKKREKGQTHLSAQSRKCVCPLFPDILKAHLHLGLGPLSWIVLAPHASGIWRLFRTTSIGASTTRAKPRTRGTSGAANGASTCANTSAACGHIAMRPAGS